jgi:hypothetical protein
MPARHTTSPGKSESTFHEALKNPPSEYMNIFTLKTEAVATSETSVQQVS